MMTSGSCLDFFWVATIAKSKKMRRNRDKGRACRACLLLLAFGLWLPDCAARTVLVFEDCPDLTTAARAVANASDAPLAPIAFPCGAAAVPPPVLSQMISLAKSGDTLFFVALITANISIPPGRSLSMNGYPEISSRIIHVPPMMPRNNQSLKEFCGRLLDPVARGLSLASSWMLYHAWTQVAVLYDQTLLTRSSWPAVRKFIEFTHRLGARLSFNKIPEMPPAVPGTTSDEGSELAAFLRDVLRRWEERDARRIVVFAKGGTLRRLLREISELDRLNTESDCDWLVFTSVRDDVSHALQPAPGHRVFFADISLDVDFLQVGLMAVRLAEDLSRSNATCSSSRKARVRLPATVYGKSPDYGRLAPAIVDSLVQPRLVPLYTWAPSPQAGVGAMKPLSAYELYQLHGAHLLVATLRSAPFIKPQRQRESRSEGTASRREPTATHVGGGGGRRQGSQRRPGHPPPHITCPQPGGFHGFLVDLIDLLSNEMNFTYTLYEVCDNSYGSRKGANWTGVVGEVINGDAHIGLGNLGANYARSLAVSFPSVSTSYGGAGIIYRRPQGLRDDLLAVFLLPFSKKVWFCIVASLPVVAFAIQLATRPLSRLRRCLPARHRPTSRGRMTELGQSASLRPRRGTTKDKDKYKIHSGAKTPARDADGGRSREDPDGDDLSLSFFSGVWFAATVYMQQGQELVPERLPARMVFGAMWVASVVLYAAYTSNLVSYFTVTKISLPINNLEQLVESEYMFGTRAGSVYLDNFKVSSNPVYSAAYSKIDSFGGSVLMSTYEEAITRALQGSYAFIGDYVVLDYYQKKDCNLVLLKQQLFESKSSFILARNSPLLPAVNHYMTVMTESGIKEKLRQKWWRSEPCAAETPLTAYNSIGLWEVCSAVLIMAVGLVLAVVVCCCESVHPRLTSPASARASLPGAAPLRLAQPLGPGGMTRRWGKLRSLLHTDM
ncbi:uncharacterized protein LOC125034786 [Penaeus chinensis]|uniref:uncharacterized protein LOC125034786 n=1 Tax=Penaeus chinensis TaxID=139456 RepID=UPI001FB5B74C|nr:uncharacterized protein LOC125034786 [Penaeus chinensis]